jgi:hypothetical protein
MRVGFAEPDEPKGGVSPMKIRKLILKIKAWVIVIFR